MERKRRGRWGLRRPHSGERTAFLIRPSSLLPGPLPHPSHGDPYRSFFTGLPTFSQTGYGR